MSIEDSDGRVTPASKVKSCRAAPGTSSKDEYPGLLVEFGSHCVRLLQFSGFLIRSYTCGDVAGRAEWTEESRMSKLKIYTDKGSCSFKPPILALHFVLTGSGIAACSPYF